MFDEMIGRRRSRQSQRKCFIRMKRRFDEIVEKLFTLFDSLTNEENHWEDEEISVLFTNSIENPHRRWSKIDLCSHGNRERDNRLAKSSDKSWEGYLFPCSMKIFFFLSNSRTIPVEDPLSFLLTSSSSTTLGETLFPITNRWIWSSFSLLVFGIDLQERTVQADINRAQLVIDVDLLDADSGPTRTTLLIQLKKIPGRFPSTKNLFWLIEKINEDFPSPQHQSIDQRNETMEDISSTERERRRKRFIFIDNSRWKLLQRNLSVCWRMTISLHIESIGKKFLPMERRVNPLGTFLSLVQTSRKDNRCPFWRHIMSPTIVEHRHIERSIGRKRWRCREKLSSDRLRSVGRWGVVSLRARPSGQSLWHCPGSNCQRRSSHINRSLIRCTFFSTTSNQLRIESEEERIDERQGEQSRSWPFIRHRTKTNPRTLLVVGGFDRWTFLCSEFNTRETERNRWWFRFWAKREEWSHLTACRRSKRDKQLKKRSVIGTFAHGGSIGGRRFCPSSRIRRVMKKWWKADRNVEGSSSIRCPKTASVRLPSPSPCDDQRVTWNFIPERKREFRRVTGSTGDTAVEGEMNPIVVENDQGSTRILSLARGMSDPWPFDRRSNETNLGKEERKGVFRSVKWSVLAAPMSILSKILPGAKSDWSIGLTKGISSTEGVEVAAGGWISRSNPKGTRRIQGANTDRNDDRLLRQGLNAQWSLRQIVTGPASTLTMGGQTDEEEGRSIGSISVLAVQADRKQRDSNERPSDWDKGDHIEEISHWTEAERDQRYASRHENKSPLSSLLINALQNRSSGWCCRRSFKEKSSNIDLPRQTEANLFAKISKSAAVLSGGMRFSSDQIDVKEEKDSSQPSGDLFPSPSRSQPRISFVFFCQCPRGPWTRWSSLMDIWMNAQIANDTGQWGWGNRCPWGEERPINH